MGFQRIILPRSNLKGLSLKPVIKMIGVDTVAEGLEASLEI
jgi:predicted ATP-dependent protease